MNFIDDEFANGMLFADAAGMCRVGSDGLKMQKTILVVDDEKPIREMLKNVLEVEGYSVVTAQDGQEGMAALREHKPCLILLDLVMPRMNGSDFLSHLRGNPEIASIPVVLLSASDELRYKPRPAPLLTKPFHLTTLLHTVQRHCA